MLIPALISVAGPKLLMTGGLNCAIVTKSCNNLTLLSNGTIATSTLFDATGSFARASLNVLSPSLSAAIGAQPIEPDVSSNRTQAHRGSGFSANSTEDSNVMVFGFFESNEGSKMLPAHRGMVVSC